MRRVGIVLLVALAAAGCGVRTRTVPGQAAPLTGTGSAPATTPATAATPAAFRSVSMTGLPARPSRVLDRYLAVWKRTTGDLLITTS